LSTIDCYNLNLWETLNNQAFTEATQRPGQATEMRNCKDCRAVWPFAFALMLAALTTFPAWATLNLMFVDLPTQIAGSALVFSLAGTGFVLYVRWCIRRNCALRRAMTERRGRLVSAPR
jgi:hypothetical protein